MRRTVLISLLVLTASLSLPASAQPIPGIHPLDPGGIFRVGGLRALLPDSDGKYQLGAIDLNAAHDGSALVFLIADPAVPKDLVEARKFEAALKKLPNTHGFLVIPPARSVLTRQVAESMNASHLTLQTVLDNRNVFPLSFRHERRDSPLYELFDRSQVLVIENASHLGQRIATGETIGDLLRLLDEGKHVDPQILPIPGAKPTRLGTKM